MTKMRSMCIVTGALAAALVGLAGPAAAAPGIDHSSVRINPEHHGWHDHDHDWYDHGWRDHGWQGRDWYDHGWRDQAGITVHIGV